MRVINVVDDFGAVGDGLIDDTAAVQAAFTYAAATPIDPDPNFPSSYTIYFPPGRYKLSAAIVGTVTVKVKGAGLGSSVLHWTTSSANGGFDLSYSTVEGHIEVSDIELRADAQNAGTAIKIACPTVASSFWPRVLLQNLLIQGGIFGNYWTNGIDVQNPWNMVVNNVNIIGKNDTSSASWLGFGFRVTGNVVSGHVFRDVNVYNAKVGWRYAAQHLEGCQFYGCAVIGGENGFDLANEVWPNGPLDVRFEKIHIAMTGVGGVGINLAGAHSTKVDGAEIYLNGSGNGQTAIRLGANCSGSNFSNLRILKTNSSPTNCLGVHAAAGADLLNVAASEFEFFNGSGDAPILLTGGATNSSISADVKYYQCNPVVGCVSPGVAWLHSGKQVNLTGWSDGGEITMPNQPAAQAYLTSTLSDIFGGNSGVDGIPFDAEAYDQAGNLSGGYFTCPVTGIYQIDVGLALDVGGAGDVYIYVKTTSQQLPIPASNSSFVTSALQSRCNAGDVIRVGIHGWSGSKSGDVVGSTGDLRSYMCVRLVA